MRILPVEEDCDFGVQLRKIDADQRWSRTIGALDYDTWRTMCSLHCTIIGVGRTGSLVARTLSQMGASHLTLVDPDRVELHNLDAMDGVGARDVGRAKVEAVADSLLPLALPALQIRALQESILALQALVAAKESDVLIACVDNDTGRLAVATIAALYGKPLLDIGTGVYGSGSRRQMGTDVPEKGRCFSR